MLFIDTSNNKRTIVRIKDQEIVENYTNPRQQRLLELIDRLLKKAKVEKKELQGIRVNTGPGSFTGLRVGCSVANTLAWVLNIKVNNKKQVQPIYS